MKYLLRISAHLITLGWTLLLLIIIINQLIFIFSSEWLISLGADQSRVFVEMFIMLSLFVVPAIAFIVFDELNPGGWVM